MKFKIFVTLTLYLLISFVAQAQTNKSIVLKDGSVLKGRIISMEGGVYTIQTPYLNEVKLEENNIESISDYQVKPVTQTQLKSEVDIIQGQVLGNPALMQEIQETMNNPAVRAIMQDPEFMKAIMSMDPTQIQNNPRTREMLNQPEIRELFQKIETSLGKTAPVE